MSTATLRLEEIVITHDGHPLIEVSASVAPGEVLTLMGPSGVGKSTLLAHVAGFLPLGFRASGHILLGDSDLGCLPPEQRRLGLLFQDRCCFRTST